MTPDDSVTVEVRGPEPRNENGVPYQFQVPGRSGRCVYLVAIGLKGEDDMLEYQAGDPCIAGFHPDIWQTREGARLQVAQLRREGFVAEIVERVETIEPVED